MKQFGTFISGTSGSGISSSDLSTSLSPSVSENDDGGEGGRRAVEAMDAARGDEGGAEEEEATSSFAEDVLAEGAQVVEASWATSSLTSEVASSSS